MLTTPRDPDWCPLCGAVTGACLTKAGKPARTRHKLRGLAVTRVTVAERLETFTEQVVCWSCPRCGEIAETTTSRVHYGRHPAAAGRAAWVPACLKCGAEVWLVATDLRLAWHG